MKLPKFPHSNHVRVRTEKWRREMIEGIEKAIDKDATKGMGGDLCFWHDVRPILEALK